MLWLPTGTVPKLRLPGLTATCAAPLDPERDMESVASDALLTTEILPESVPDDVGENVALKLALPPAARVRGSAMPLTLKPVPDELIADIFTLEVPVAMRVTV